MVQEGSEARSSAAQSTPLAVPSNVQAFYAEGRWSTRFGATGPYYGPLGHRGLDIAASAGQAIPALRSGTVRRIQYSSIVGHTIAVESAPGDFSGYDHIIRTQVSVGDFVQQGDIIAYAAGPGDDHGSAWTGPHLHMTRGSTDRCAFGENVSDPAPSSATYLAPEAAAVQAPVEVPGNPDQHRGRKDSPARRPARWLHGRGGRRTRSQHVEGRPDRHQHQGLLLRPHRRRPG
ncbi:M23 family metallopeptidase [Cystobacter fuscus]